MGNASTLRLKGKPESNKCEREIQRENKIPRTRVLKSTYLKELLLDWLESTV